MVIKELGRAVFSALESKRGAAMVEYALLAGLIAVVAVSALSSLGSGVTTEFASISASI